MKMEQIIVKIFITIFLVYGMYYVWTKEIDFKSIIQEPFNKAFHLKSKVSYPQFQNNLNNVQMKYKDSLIVEGISWKKEFQEYKFTFKYSDNELVLNDFKIDIQIPGGILFFKTIESSGFDSLNVFVKEDNFCVGSNDVTHKLIKYYSNHIFVNSLKIYPNSNLSIKLIVIPDLDYNNGFVKYDFNFIDEKNNIIDNDWVYPMNFTIANGFVNFEIKKEFVIGKYDYNIKYFPVEPIPMPVGEFIQKGI